MSFLSYNKMPCTPEKATDFSDMQGVLYFGVLHHDILPI